jgi:hypothetical protein
MEKIRNVIIIIILQQISINETIKTQYKQKHSKYKYNYYQNTHALPLGRRCWKQHESLFIYTQLFIEHDAFT